MTLDRREMIRETGRILLIAIGATEAPGASTAGYDPARHRWGMTIDIDKCIGCGNCVQACEQENNVPKGHFRTWIERYQVDPVNPEHPKVESPGGGRDGFPALRNEADKSFFVPKICNHCTDSPCIQVCPVGATFDSPDGVVLMDESYCLGCRYCIQACPYGCRFINPNTQVANKCTFCYHRITKGLTTACSEACPTGARQLADLKDPNDPVHKFLKENKIQVLKPHMATGAKVYYRGLDGAVR